jgi:hypothetical protein
MRALDQHSVKVFVSFFTGAIFGAIIAGAVVFEYFSAGNDLETAETVLIEEGSQFSASLIPMDEGVPQTEVGGLLYVPIYSTVYRGDRSAYSDLAATLIIHNVSLEHDVYILRIAYYDMNGQLIEEQVNAPHRLTAMATTEFYIDTEDLRGGTAANFLVEWSAPSDAPAPLVEAVMIGGPYSSVNFAVRGYSIPQ